MKINNYYIDSDNVLHTYIGDTMHVTFENVTSEEQAQVLIAEENEMLIETEIMKAGLVQGLFAIDDGTDYSGMYNPNENWNGFAIPYFDRSTAFEILNDLKCDYDYDEENIWFEEGEDQPMEKVGNLYSVGGRYWTWVHIPDHVPTVIVPLEVYNTIYEAARKYKDDLESGLDDGTYEEGQEELSQLKLIFHDES